ncbi:metal ABC transporter substrate-binding protein [Anoxybacillus sp. UARK-01]|uniref:MetQ/NlpA family ABC transporter substrate-binding protein n=1 Tax=Anoxybacillus sp. UARK-01 TaxID=1895648 RepID=UPI0009BA5777|nr:MetQ/NlpA family ABC transporter substrate-binding protein [Anoxybacillus sp. UARK-01]OQM45933.1 metal ABC transporter substrate-binding protein [Anoxybacillus sp. UARK-01]
MRKTIILALFLLVAIIAGCSGESQTTSKELSDKKLVVGVTAGPHEEILEVVKQVAEKDGLEIELKVFSDYITPNTALAEGDLDANSYQHKPFLEQFNEDHNTNLVPVAKTVLNPMGVYSKKYKNINELETGAKFGLPNDPTNGSRALHILEKEGLVKLKDEKKYTASIYDIVENPKKLEFVELEAAQIPKHLSEVDLAAINTNFALGAGLNPKKDSILLESPDSDYVNYLVVRPENKEDKAIQKLIKAYHSDEVKKFIEDKFEGSVIPGW